MLIDFHRTMLLDKPRNAAFYAALQKLIVPGKSVVADIGSGTGLLAFLARQLGAKDCYLFEYTDALKLSQILAKKNRISRCHFIHEHSTRYAGDLEADIIVSETLGNFAYEENIIETIEDAKRFLKPGGVIVPQMIDQFVAPVTSERFYGELCAWDDVGFELDFAAAKAMSMNNLYVRTMVPSDFAAEGLAAQRWDRVDFRRNNSSERKGSVNWTAKEPATIYGLGLWWRCELVPGVELSTSPHANLTHWEQLYAPVATPITLQAGDKLSVALQSDTRLEVGVNLQWEVRVERSGEGVIERQKMDMRAGFMG